jgi:type I restriction enzyme M protein
MNDHFAAWRQTTATSLKNLQPGFQPKALIKTLAEGLLAYYEGLPLIDAYERWPKDCSPITRGCR